VKRTLLVPVVFLLNVLLFSAIIGLFVYLYEPPGMSATNMVGPIVLGAVFPAFILTIVRSVLKPIVPLLFLVLLTASAGLTLGGALFLDGSTGYGVTGDPALRRRLPERVILSGTDVSIRIGDATGVALSDILVARHNELPVLDHQPEGTWNAVDSRIVFSDGESVSTEQFSEILWWHAPRTLRNIAEDISLLFAALAAAFHDRMIPDFLVIWIAFLVALAAVWTPARLFRWPLLNLVIALAYLRFVLGVPAWAGGLIEKLPLISRLPPVLVAHPAVLIWTVSAVLLLGVSLFLPGLSLWQREVAEEGGGE